MEETLLLLLGIAFCLTTITFLRLSQRQRDILLSRFRLRGRRTSSAKTPPRSLSPEKAPVNAPALTTNEWLDTFAPTRRDALLEVAKSLPLERGKKISSEEASQDVLKESIMPFTTDYTKCDGSKYTATGISIDEIRALGDFPDYAELSGVPLPEAYTEFNIETAMPRPYRPFRWAYHQTMSLTKLEPDWWLELENTYKSRIAQRRSLYEKHGKSVLQHLPGSELACKELMEMALQFLCARYPQYFVLSNNNKTLENKILGNVQDLTTTHPLIVILDNVPEDFAVMLRNPETGYYHFRAGVICSALGWNLGTKIGLQLHQIHAPIPDYKERMQFSMDRYFARLPCDRPIQRGSWGLEVDQPLYMPPNDPHEKYRDYQSPDLTLDRCHLRVDWQTLRRLPLSGAIVFNFKALFTPVKEFRDEPFIPSLVTKVLKEGKKNMMEYKNTWHVEHVCVPAFEEYEKEQVEKGLVPENWEHHTLNESPWFPGWQEKWKRQQGY